MVYGKLNGRSKTKYRIKTPDRLFFTFSHDEVDRYIPAILPVSSAVRERKTGGINFIIECGIHVGSAEDNFPIHYSFSPMIDYSFNTFHSLSAGSGLEDWDKLMLPLFVEYKVNLSKKNVTPFLNFRIGVLIQLQSDVEDLQNTIDYRNGWTFATGFGLLWPLGNIESYVKMGYRYAYSRYIVTYLQAIPPYGIIDHKQNFNCVEMKWGFEF
jgi:hypothetical protein